MPAKRYPAARHLVKSLAGALAATACLAAASAPGVAAGAGSGATHTAADTLGVATTGNIAQFAVNSPAMVQAEWIAVKHWNTSPCSGVVSVVWTPLDNAINAASTWWNPVAAYGNAGANSQCKITFNSNQDFDWPMFCTVMVHEIGHLVGQQHSTDPASVMYPTYVSPIPECAGTPAGSPAPAPAPAAAASPVATQATATSQAVATGHHKAHNRHKTHKTRKHHKATK